MLIMCIKDAMVQFSLTCVKYSVEGRKFGFLNFEYLTALLQKLGELFTLRTHKEENNLFAQSEHGFISRATEYAAHARE